MCFLSCVCLVNNMNMRQHCALAAKAEGVLGCMRSMGCCLQQVKVDDPSPLLVRLHLQFWGLQSERDVDILERHQ